MVQKYIWINIDVSKKALNFQTSGLGFTKYKDQKQGEILLNFHLLSIDELDIS